MGPSPPSSSRPRGPRPTPRPVARSSNGDAPISAPSRSQRLATLEEAPSALPEVPVADAPEVLDPVGPTPVASRPGYIPALDGLRAVAVLAVVAYHLDELKGGFFGVDIFFVISGFLITRLLMAEEERTGKVALGSFWIRRFKRLLPALFVVLVAVAIGSRLWLPAFRLAEIRLDALAGLFYVANWRFVLSGQSYFASGIAPSPLRHTWSLAIEEQFYLLWPLVVVGLAKFRPQHLRRSVGIVAAVAALASVSWMAVSASIGMDLSRIYYGTDTRVFALFGGALLGTWWDPASQRGETRADRRRWSQRWAVAGTVAFIPVVGFLVFGSNSEAIWYQGAFQLLAVLAVVLVAGMATGRGPLAAFLGTGPLVWVGRRSYGIYLWSWPVQVFLAEYWKLEGLVLNASVVGLAVSLAAISFWLVEEPIRTGQRPAGFGQRRADRGAPRVPKFALSGLALVLVVGVIVGTSTGAPKAPDYTSVSDEEVLDAALGDMTAAEEAELRNTTTTDPAEVIPPGPFTSAPDIVVDPTASVDPSLRLGRPLKVMVAGDSVGWSIGWKLGPTVVDSVAIADRAVIGCGLMPRTSKFIVGSRDPEQYSELCEKVDLVELKGLGNNPDVVLLWVGAWEVYDHEVDGERLEVGTDEYADFLADRMQERIDKYRGIGAATVMPVVPCFGVNAARLGNERRDAERVDWINDVVRDVAERNNGWVRLIDPWDQLCDDDGEALTSTPDGIPLREDGSHLDPPAAVWFWNAWLAGQMGAAFDVPNPPTPTTTTSTTTVATSSTTSTTSTTISE